MLLGGPGAGKTTEFEVESRDLGESAEFVSARDFLAESRPEWRDKTLFIDGLDEIRAGCSRRTYAFRSDPSAPSEARAAAFPAVLSRGGLAWRKRPGISRTCLFKL